MALDLSGLERAAARVGLPDLQARIVPPDPRRDRWFTWVNGELLVSERIVERLTPADAEALLVNVVLRRRRLDRLHGPVVASAFAAGLACLGVFAIEPAWLPWAGLAAAVLVAAGAFAASMRATIAADDESVRFLGDAETLVRAMNTMNQDQIRVGRWQTDARPDVHRRAERLVEKHQLRLPPERRTVPPIAATTPSDGADA